MPQVIVLKVAEDCLGDFYFEKNIEDKARQLRRSGNYSFAYDCTIDAEGEDAAEEMFDLTNNPSRQEEREQKYGRQRSISVGDIVEVDGVDYLCAPTGWRVL